MRKPKLGHINFINCLPLDYGLTQGGFAQGLDIYPQVPSALNQAVVAGQLDISPVSSIMYALHADQFALVPNVSISAAGALQSILLVAKRPIEELDGAQIALTSKSATSHVLLKIVMQQAYHLYPQYAVSTLSLAEGVLDTADAVLFIGDDALHAYLNRQDGYYYYDMGAEWRKLTGLSMVYAVWVVNRKFAQENPVLMQYAYEQVTGAFHYGLTHVEAAAAVRERHAPFSARQISDYLKLLNYDLTLQHKEALLTYYRRARELGLLQAVPELKMAEVRP